jgi:hypothetical protein
MLDTAVIGSNGLIGTEIVKFFKPSLTFNSNNINSLHEYKFSKVIIAAPSGNRRNAEQYPQADLANINALIKELSLTYIETIVLISSIDTIAYNNTHYGNNRKLLENFVKERFINSYVIRLCTLIAPTIKKNVLYDLRHKQFLDSINPDSVLQWYPLDRLENDIDFVIANGIQDSTLVSDPIQNKEIIDRFFPEYPLGVASSTLLCYNITPTQFNKEEIFSKIAEYLK